MTSFDYKLSTGEVVNVDIANPQPAMEKLAHYLSIRPQTWSTVYNRPLTFLEWIGEPCRVDSVYYHRVVPGQKELEVTVRHYHEQPVLCHQVDTTFVNDPLLPPIEPNYIPAHWIKKKRGRPRKNRQTEEGGGAKGASSQPNNGSSSTNDNNAPA